MLKNNFYFVRDLSNSDGKISARIIFSVEHDIFKGHFPGQPVVPGVCMIQIVKEIMCECMEQKLNMIKASQIKFLSMIDPRQTPEVSLFISWKQAEEELLVDANLKNESTVFFKMKAIFRQEAAGSRQ